MGSPDAPWTNSLYADEFDGSFTYPLPRRTFSDLSPS